MSINTGSLIQDDQLHRMVMFAVNAVYLDPYLLRAAFEELNSCPLSIQQSAKISDILANVPSGNRDQAAAVMKERIIAVLSTDVDAAPNSSPSNTTSTTSTTSVIGTEIMEVDSDPVTTRKKAAIVRLGEIDNIGDDRINRFESNAAIMTFDLDALLQKYDANHAPSRLCELLGWANCDDKGLAFSIALQRYQGSFSDGSQERVVRILLSKMFSYFEQKRNQIGHSEEELKEQFRAIVDKMIDANNNCVDQTLSQLQDMMLDLVADDFTATEGGDKQLQRIQFRAGHALAKHRSQLLKQVIYDQNPNELHMADVERVVMQRLAEVLGLKGSVFEAGARYGDARFIHDINGKVERAIDAFQKLYKPLQYLANELKTPFSNVRKLRTDFIQWADSNYAIGDEDEDVVKETDMNRLLSADYDAGMTGPFNFGGDWTPAATLFLMEAAGLIKHVGNNEWEKQIVQEQAPNNQGETPTDVQSMHSIVTNSPAQRPFQIDQTYWALITNNVFQQHHSVSIPFVGSTVRHCNRGQGLGHNGNSSTQDGNTPSVDEAASPTNLSFNPYGFDLEDIYEESAPIEQGYSVFMTNTVLPTSQRTPYVSNTEHTSATNGNSQHGMPSIEDLRQALSTAGYRAAHETQIGQASTFGRSSTQGGNAPLVVGGFSPSGFYVNHSNIDTGNLGVGARRRFGAEPSHNNNVNNNNSNNVNNTNNDSSSDEEMERVD